MGAVTAVANNKGGVSKTTTACNAAYCLAARGAKVLLVDMDGQGNATRSYGLFADGYQVCMYHLLLDRIRVMLRDRPRYSVEGAVVRTGYGVDLLPCDARVSEISTWLQDHAGSFRGSDIERYWREEFPYFLANILAGIRDAYDHVIIDTPPAFEYNTKASLIASDYIVVPVELGDLEFTGLESLFQRISTFKKEYDCRAVVLGILVNRYDWGRKGSRTVVERDLEGQLRSHAVLGNYVFDTVIYRNTSIREAAVVGKLAATYEKRRTRSAGENFNRFVDELLAWMARGEVTASGNGER